MKLRSPLRIPLLVIALLTLLAAPLLAQTAPAAPAPAAVANPSQALQLENPLSVVNDATRAIPGFEGGISSTINIMILLTVLSLAPAILILCTSFTRIIVVLALLRQAMGTQTLPPTQVLIGLALFMTFLVMAPVLQEVNRSAIAPLSDGKINQIQAWSQARQPLREFMFNQIERCGNWSDVYMVLNYRGVDTSRPDQLRRQDVDMISLIPAFILSELKTAFLIGFRLYLPFLIIDMVVSSLLISMGMLMLPPVLISLPFKLLLFVMVDGWRLVVGNLLDSFVIPVMHNAPNVANVPGIGG